MGRSGKIKKKIPPQPRNIKSAAYVTLPCKVAGRRLNLRLGEWLEAEDDASPEAWAEHGRILGEWKASGGVVAGVIRKPDGTFFEFAPGEAPDPISADSEPEDDTDADEDFPGEKAIPGSVWALWICYESTATLTAHAKRVLNSVKPELLGRYRHMPAHLFTPLSLIALIDCWVKETNNSGELLTRQTISRRKRAVINIFNHGVVMGIVHNDVADSLEKLPKNTRGRKKRKIRPIADEQIWAIWPYLSSVLKGMILAQRRTGMRPDEVCCGSTSQTDITLPIWEYRPEHFKTDYIEDRQDVIMIGPWAQLILRHYMYRPFDRPWFSPREATEEWLRERAAGRATPINCGNRPGRRSGGNAKARGREPGDRYTTASYRRAIHRACDKAGIPRWSPNRIRKLAATRIRKKHGLEAASVILRHNSAELTDETYAERDADLARQAARESG